MENREDNKSKGLKLAFELLRNEAKPSSENCTRLLKYASDMGEGLQQGNKGEREMWNIMNKAIGVCKRDIVTPPRRTPSRKPRTRKKNEDEET